MSLECLCASRSMYVSFGFGLKQGRGRGIPLHAAASVVREDPLAAEGGTPRSRKLQPWKTFHGWRAVRRT